MNTKETFGVFLHSSMMEESMILPDAPAPAWTMQCWWLATVLPIARTTGSSRTGKCRLAEALNTVYTCLELLPHVGIKTFWGNFESLYNVAVAVLYNVAVAVLYNVAVAVQLNWILMKELVFSQELGLLAVYSTVIPVPSVLTPAQFLLPSSIPPHPPPPSPTHTHNHT